MSRKNGRRRRVETARRRHVVGAIAILSAGAGLVIGGCGDDSEVVGGSCAVPFSNCSNACVDLSDDPLNCGVCGNACAPGTPCASGMCVGARDATIVSDANDEDEGFDGGPGCCGEDGSSRHDGEAGDGGNGDGNNSTDGTFTDGNPNETSVSEAGDVVSTDACMPPYDTPQQCGDCFTQCAAPNNLCTLADGGFACAPQCTPPQISCGTICVDPTSDPFNCGGCGIFCPTFICTNSMCVGSTPGEVALIGHDYATSIPPTVPQAHVLTNAVFVHNLPRVRVLAYQHYANAQNVANVTAILKSYATSNGRTLALTPTSTDGDIPSMLTITSFDVLLVYDEPSAGANTLGPLGTSWASTLATYTQEGGIVVVLDGATAPDMPLFITRAGLLNVTAQTVLPSTERVINIAPGDTLGSGVQSPYKVTNESARFAADPPSTKISYVIFDQAGNEPVVIHRLFN